LPRISGSGTEYATYEDKKALPELLLKQQIAIIDRGLVISAFKTLERNKRMNNGVVSQIDKAGLEAELCGLFLDIKTMIQSKKKYASMNDFERENFNNLSQLVMGKASFKVLDLVAMMNYLMRMLHDLNLTNLLINERGPFDDWKQGL
jgi:hypothetical protein